MKNLSKYSKLIPYFYALAVVGYWFTDVNKTEGVNAFPILLFGLPFLWQVVFPKKKSSPTYGIAFICLSLYVVLNNVLDISIITSVTKRTIDFVVYGGLFVISLATIQFWVDKNYVKQSV